MPAVGMVQQIESGSLGEGRLNETVDAFVQPRVVEAGPCHEDGWRPRRVRAESVDG